MMQDGAPGTSREPTGASRVSVQTEVERYKTELEQFLEERAP